MNNLKSIYGSTPPVVKNLIILNVLFYLATIAGGKFGVDLSRALALYFPLAEHFQPYQFITHMFMHGNLGHLFFNMFALWMFGRVLESVWGGKRFFIFYFVTGLGAAAFYTFVNWIEFAILKGKMSPEQVQMVLENGQGILQNMQNYSDPAMGKMNLLLNVPVLGASGAVFGILLGFGMLFPNTQLMLLFPPIPIKAKYFVILYGILELVLAFTQQGGNVAHFAHLGGMIFGYILIKTWNKDRTHFY
ncbi:MAG: rhomboid family intramembrane serine protease [Bacteroidales bacterium]|nr:rhomboid family intramembrane serine protease [Bacteroidales bacterium]